MRQTRTIAYTSRPGRLSCGLRWLPACEDNRRSQFYNPEWSSKVGTNKPICKLLHSFPNLVPALGSRVHQKTSNRLNLNFISDNYFRIFRLRPLAWNLHARVSGLDKPNRASLRVRCSRCSLRFARNDASVWTYSKLWARSITGPVATASSVADV